MTNVKMHKGEIKAESIIKEIEGRTELNGADGSYFKRNRKICLIMKRSLLRHIIVPISEITLKLRDVLCFSEVNTVLFSILRTRMFYVKKKKEVKTCLFIYCMWSVAQCFPALSRQSENSSQTPTLDVSSQIVQGEHNEKDRNEEEKSFKSIRCKDCKCFEINLYL